MALKTFTGSATDAVAAIDSIGINTKVTITGADYTAGELKTINAATNEKIVLQKAAELLTGTLSELEAALDGIKYTGAITVTGTTTANIDAALQLTTGKVTAPVVGLAADLVEALTPNAKATDALTLTVSAGTVAASDLKALDAKTSVAVDASAVTEITGNATELKAIFKAATATTPTITLAAGVDVTVTGTVSAADVNTLADATTGAVTADVTGSAAALNAALKVVNTTDDTVTATLTGTTAAAKDLIELTGKVTTLDVSSLKTITGDLADINTVTTAGATDVAVTITGTVPASSFATLNSIATNTGVVKATVEGAVSDLIQLTSTSTDLLTLKITDASVTAADLITIDGKTAVVVNASAVTTISGNAANLKTIYASKTISGLGNEAVNIAPGASAKDANVILKATTGVVTATVADTATNLVKALTDAKATDNLTLTVDAGTATAAELKALDAKASTVDATAVTEITGNAADVKVVLTADGITKSGTEALKITGTVSALDANIIAGATSGKVTATVTAGTAADLNAKLIDAAGTDALTLTVNGKTAAATDLNDLDGKTSVDVKVDATEVTGDFVDLKAVYVTNKANFTNLGNETVKITDATVSATDANTIANATTGKVTATVTANAAATLVDDLANAVSTDALTLTVNATPTQASDLILLDGKTSVDVIVNATTVTGTFAELNKVYVANKANFAALGDEAVTINDTTVSAAQANTIANATTGVVTATVADATAASLNAALKNAVATDALTLTVNGATATAADLNALDGKTKEVITVEAKAVTGTFADLNKVYVTNAANFSGLNDENVTITDKTVSASDANIIANVVDGKVTATVTAADAATLVGALTNAAATDALTLTVNGATATAADLNALDGKTSVDVKVDATAVTGSYTDLYTMYVTNKANFTALGNENITIDAGATAEQINTIANLTTGKVTAAITDTAANLVAALKNSTGDALSLTVNGVAKAADLITLDGKTATDITVSAVTAITGTYAELYKVYHTDALNFAGLGSQNVTITDKVTVDQINVIRELIDTGKIVTAAVSGSAADLAKLNTVGADAITLTVSGTTATAADLNILNAKTSVPVNAASVTTITSDAANVADVLTAYTANTNGTITGLGNEAVTITGAISAANANSIADATSGKVTATVTAGTADYLVTNSAHAVSTDALTLTVDATAPAAPAAADKLNTLDGRTSVAVKVDATAVAGTYSDLSKVYVTNKANFTGLGNETVTISDSVSAAQANTIALATTGAVTAATVEAATAVALNTALTDTTVNAYSLTLTDTNLSSLTNLIALDGKTTGIVNADSLSTISETFDHLTTVYTSAGITGLTDQAVTITDTQSAANVNTFLAETSGVVTATVTAATAAALNSGLAAVEVNALTLKITDTSLDSTALTNLAGLDGKTSVAVDASAVTAISGSSVEVAAAYAANTAGTITGLGNETVNLSADTAATVTNVAAINTATTGLVTVEEVDVTGANFSLAGITGLGDLSGITGLTTIDATNGATTTLNLNLADLLAANDGATAITINLGAGDTITGLSVATGWAKTTVDQVDTYKHTTGITEDYVITVTNVI